MLEAGRGQRSHAEETTEKITNLLRCRQWGTYGVGHIKQHSYDNETSTGI
jgi:hypothetical protein